MPEDFLSIGAAPFSVLSLLFSLAVGALMSLILTWHFRRFGSTLSNRDELANVLPFILLTTILIISIVKSSLALSLGLVGALSIVRFRTPIKEPEELAYLFIAIGIGLGLGAEQVWPTVTAGLCIFGLMAAFKWRTQGRSGQSLHLFVQLRDNVPDRFLEQLNEIMVRHGISCELRRYASSSRAAEIAYVVDLAAPDKLTAITREIKDLAAEADVTFLDQTGLPSV